jgi:riboflavin synthase
MFTGIVSELGKVKAITDKVGNRVFTILAPKTCKGLEIGDSVAVNGACHTVVKKLGQSFVVQSIPETLSRTNLGQLEINAVVNLERPVVVGGRLDGHIVTGHVDVTVRLSQIIQSGGGVTFTFTANKQDLRYIVEKGSVTLDGVSLTVAAVTSKSFSVALIPHTLAVTTFGTRKVGDLVNLEVDILAKHVEKLIKSETANS